MHLSAICTLRDFLTQENHRELLEEASRKTKKQAEGTGGTGDGRLARRARSRRLGFDDS